MAVLLAEKTDLNNSSLNKQSSILWFLTHYTTSCWFCIANALDVSTSYLTFTYSETSTVLTYKPRLANNSRPTSSCNATKTKAR